MQPKSKYHRNFKKSNMDEKWFVKTNQVYEQLRYEVQNIGNVELQERDKGHSGESRVQGKAKVRNEWKISQEVKIL